MSLYPAGGFTSITLAHQAAEFIRDEVDAGEKESAEIIYIGDYDPAGVLIDRDIESKLRLHLGNDFPLNFHRIAINEAQIDEYDLPRKPRKASDVRSRQVVDTVEAEAMPAATLRSMLRGEIERYLPSHALTVAKIVEREEREGMQILARHLDNSGLSGVLDKLVSI